MLLGSWHFGKILGYCFSPSTSRCSDLSRRVGRGDIWWRQEELLVNRVYNKPNDCSATGALAPGPDHQQQQQQQQSCFATLRQLTARSVVDKNNDAKF
jgi:hypothetical protein